MNNDVFKTVFQVTHSGGSGSCFYLKSLNIFVTNNHVVEGFQEVAIHDHFNNAHLAKVVLVNPVVDLALLAVEGDFDYLPTLSLADDDSLKIGDTISVAGYPYGMPFTVTEGTVSSPKQLMDGRYFIQTDAAVNPGNSGGPMFNRQGEVVGVTVAKFTDADNMGFAIRIEDLKALLDSIEILDRSKFHVQCASCEHLIPIDKSVEFCPTCGEALPEGVFEQTETSPLSQFCEQAISDMGFNPVLARYGEELWQFYPGSAQLRIAVHDNAFLVAMSPINLLPKKDVEPILDYILTKDLTPFKLGIKGRNIYLVYRVHLTDITAETEREIRDNLTQLATLADSIDDRFVRRFGCEFSEYTKPEHNKAE